jgi:hypothetical protein
MSFNIASKIRKLMTLAERGEGNEAEVAAEMAQRLMREHAISMASLKETEILEQDPLLELAFEVGQSSWKIALAWALGTHCQVSALRCTRHASWHPTQKDERGIAVNLGSRKTRIFAWGYGHSSDLEVWEYLYEVAVRQIECEARKYAQTLKADEFAIFTSKDMFIVDGDIMSKRKAMNRFRAGAVAGLSAKLHQQRQEAKAKAQAESEAGPGPTESSETTIAVQAIASRYKRADDYMRSKNRKLGSGYKGGVRSSSAGVRAGRNISINKGVNGGRGPKLLGC